jgi:hypothetical protein
VNIPLRDRDTPSEEVGNLDQKMEFDPLTHFERVLLTIPTLLCW